MCNRENARGIKKIASEIKITRKAKEKNCIRFNSQLPAARVVLAKTIA